jgi:hypothetical protein
VKTRQITIVRLRTYTLFIAYLLIHVL